MGELKVSNSTPSQELNEKFIAKINEIIRFMNKPTKEEDKFIKAERNSSTNMPFTQGWNIRGFNKESAECLIKILNELFIKSQHYDMDKPTKECKGYIMTLSEWKNYGKKYGYWDYFVEQLTQRKAKKREKYLKRLS